MCLPPRASILNTLYEVLIGKKDVIHITPMVEDIPIQKIIHLSSTIDPNRSSKEIIEDHKWENKNINASL